VSSYVKVFITRQIDRFRKKYDREISEHPRRSVLCGTVNKTCFLVDDTGNTRFLIVPVPEVLGKLNTALFRSERDGIWASAVDAYFAGERWELSEDEEIFSEENNRQFEVPDTWETEIEHYLRDKDEVSVLEILVEVFNFDSSQRNKANQMKVASILGKIGWNRAGVQVYQGKRQPVWKIGVKNYNPQVLKKGVEGVAGVAIPVTERVSSGNTSSQGVAFLEKGVADQQNGADTKLNDQHLCNTSSQGVAVPNSVSEPLLDDCNTYNTFFEDFGMSDVVSPNFAHTTKENDQNSPDQKEEAKPDPCDQEIRAGDWVELVHVDGHEGDRYRVKNCGSTHVEIEGCSDRRAVPVWAVKRVQIGEKRNK
jgi:hypothetical protein